VMNLRKELQDNLWEAVVESASSLLLFSLVVPVPSSLSLFPHFRHLHIDSKLCLFLEEADFDDPDAADDFEKYWNVAAKLVPLPAPPSVGSKKPTRTTPLSSSGEGGRSGSSSSSSQEPDANGVKHVPLRVYLPAPPPSPSGGGGGGGGGGGAVNGAVTVVQEPVAPTRRDGEYLCSALLFLLAFFPSAPKSRLFRAD
jgi:uncharacterized membrane protein YgcG